MKAANQELLALPKLGAPPSFLPQLQPTFSGLLQLGSGTFDDYVFIDGSSLSIKTSLKAAL